MLSAVKCYVKFFFYAKFFFQNRLRELFPSIAASMFVQFEQNL